MTKLEIFEVPQSSYVRTARMVAVEKGVEKALESNAFLVGDQLTLADLFIAPRFSYLGNMPDVEELFEVCTNICAASRNMAERQSFKRHSHLHQVNDTDTKRETRWKN